VTAGEGATFTAAASGIPTPSVQWQVSTNGSTYANDTTDAGNTTGTLTVASTTTALSGRSYRAVFTSSSGSATTAAATLTVNAKPEAPNVATNPASKTVSAGTSATFAAVASGFPAPKVQWQVSTNGGTTFTNDTADAGNTTGTVTVASTTTTLSGHRYRAVFTNASGSATTTAATLTVTPAAPVVTSLSPNSGGTNSLVTITGKNFTGAQGVYFGTKSAAGFVLSSTQLLVVVPAGSGTVDVTVKTSSGTSATSSADRFTYTATRRG
jgi:TIG domain/Immunoglobulin I-set domain